MVNEILNVGEGLYTIGVMAAIAMTKNYWLLLFMILPLCTWSHRSSSIQDKYNKYVWKHNELELEKLQEEIRLLKVRTK